MCQRNEKIVKQPVHLPSLTALYTKEAVGSLWVGRACYKWQMFHHRMLLIGELHAEVNIIVLPVSSLFRVPPPTPSPGQISQSTYMGSLSWIPDCQAISRDIYICFQFSGQSHFNHSARGSFGDSLGELDTSVGVGKQCSATSYFKYFCLLTKTIMPSRERYPSEATNALHCNGFLPLSTDFSR